MKTLFFFLLLTQNFDKIITGKLRPEIFSTDLELKQWYVKEYESYNPNKSLITQLRKNLTGKTITVALGTWCNDSQREFPRLMKVLNEAKFPLANLMLYGTNKDKTTPVEIISKLKIINVPTIIVLNADGTERGRITESVKKSTEEDLESILR